jgi:hypothetical protein
MSFLSVFAWGMYALSLPFVAIVFILAHYSLRRVLFRSGRRGKDGRYVYCPSSAGLGMAFQYMQVFTRPSVAYVLEEKQSQKVDEDDDGGPDPLAARMRHFHRQLRKIRRGDPVDRLILRI